MLRAARAEPQTKKRAGAMAMVGIAVGLIAGVLVLMLRAMQSGLAYRKLSGASLGELLRSALAMQRSEKMSRAQTLMAANAPILVRKAMVEGDPVEGVLPSGTVAALIDDRPSCGEIIQNIVSEAEQRLEALAN